MTEKQIKKAMFNLLKEKKRLPVFQFLIKSRQKTGVNADVAKRLMWSLTAAGQAEFSDNLRDILLVDPPDPYL